MADWDIVYRKPVQWVVWTLSALLLFALAGAFLWIFGNRLAPEIEEPELFERTTAEAALTSGAAQAGGIPPAR